VVKFLNYKLHLDLNVKRDTMDTDMMTTVIMDTDMANMTIIKIITIIKNIKIITKITKNTKNTRKKERVITKWNKH